MLQITLHLNRSSVSSPITKKAASTVSVEIHKGAIFDRLKKNFFFHFDNFED
jgi:hypothetical protein